MKVDCIFRSKFKIENHLSHRLRGICVHDLYIYLYIKIQTSVHMNTQIQSLTSITPKKKKS